MIRITKTLFRKHQPASAILPSLSSLRPSSFSSSANTNTHEQQGHNHQLDIIQQVTDVQCKLNSLNHTSSDRKEKESKRDHHFPGSEKLSYSFAFAQPNSERDVYEKSSFDEPTLFMDDSFLNDKNSDIEKHDEESVRIMKSQLRFVESKQQRTSSTRSNIIDLPQNFTHEFNTSNEAIVITEPIPPFRIVAVNQSWEDLCGFTQNEVQGKTLSIIQGEKTEKDKITNLLNTIIHKQEDGVGTTLTNYKKSGEEFQNRLVLKFIRDEQAEQHTDRISYLAGYLKQIQSDMDSQVYA